jgi:hypothetical protein
MRRRKKAAPCWSPFWPVRAATPSAASPKPYGKSEHASNRDSAPNRAYGGKEGILRYLREQRSRGLTGIGGHVLRQLLTGRAAVHKLADVTRGKDS